MTFATARRSFAATSPGLQANIRRLNADPRIEPAHLLCDPVTVIETGTPGDQTAAVWTRGAIDALLALKGHIESPRVAGPEPRAATVAFSTARRLSGLTDVELVAP